MTMDEVAFMARAVETVAARYPEWEQDYLVDRNGEVTCRFTFAAAPD